MREINALKKTILDIEELPNNLYTEKTFMFINQKCSLIIKTNYASEALEWLEKNDYIPKEKLIPQYIFFQLEDSHIKMLKDKDERYICGNLGIEPFNWDSVEKNLRKILNLISTYE
ncbi:hypothetical protein [Enterococcus thailandicus]|uniref:hypothetical protein n=1 Tax=Enterococcus thailandicus TaxID=417368 RepID=UPI00398561E0